MANLIRQTAVLLAITAVGLTGTGIANAGPTIAPHLGAIDKKAPEPVLVTEPVKPAPPKSEPHKVEPLKAEHPGTVSKVEPKGPTHDKELHDGDREERRDEHSERPKEARDKSHDANKPLKAAAGKSSCSPHDVDRRAGTDYGTNDGTGSDDRDDDDFGPGERSRDGKGRDNEKNARGLKPQVSPIMGKPSSSNHGVGSLVAVGGRGPDDRDPKRNQRPREDTDPHEQYTGSHQIIKGSLEPARPGKTGHPDDPKSCGASNSCRPRDTEHGQEPTEPYHPTGGVPKEAKGGPPAHQPQPQLPPQAHQPQPQPPPPQHPLPSWSPLPSPPQHTGPGGPHGPPPHDLPKDACHPADKCHDHLPTNPGVVAVPEPDTSLLFLLALVVGGVLQLWQRARRVRSV